MSTEQGTEEQDVTQTSFVTVDTQGRIHMSASMPRFMVDLQPLPDGHVRLFGSGSFITDYVKDGQILPRPVSTATLNGMTLENLPNPCTITMQGNTHACTDPTCELSFSQPGTYTVVVSAFPMLDATFQVTQS